jgi:hypothetical protein
MIMPLTRSFRETVQARARRDVKFRQALLGEAMQMLLAALGRSPKSLMRMFGLGGNPTAENLLAVIGVLQGEAGGPSPS